MTKFARKTGAKFKLAMMAFIETIYAIWHQRNQRIFTNSAAKPKVIARDIVYRMACRSNGVMRDLLIV